MNKKSSFRYRWLGWLVLLVALNYLARQFHYRLDLTEERRFTLSKPTLDLLSHLPGEVDIDVLLAGDMPAGFRKLAASTQDMLEEFKEVSKGRVRFAFNQPMAGLDDSSRAYLMDSLQKLGLSPMNVKAQVKEGQGQEERYLYPGAVVSYQDRVLAVDFLKGQSSVNGINSLNNAEALLEYQLGSSIRNITEDTVPLVGYLIGNGEPFSSNVYDLVERNLRKNYAFNFLNIDSVTAIPPQFSAMLIVKPTQKFTDLEKLKLDQYIMRGGKVLWMIDNLYAEMDSLKRVENSFVAFDRGLNIQDQLFKYGVRINLDLVQDLNCDRLPSIVGSEGGKPQVELLPWYYDPLVSNYSGDNPISKNLDYVLTQFPNSLDTVKAPGIKKTFLLTSSDASRVLNSPAIVAWNSVSSEQDTKTFTSAYIPVAVLLEGSFSSLFTNRLGQAMRDSLEAIHQPFVSRSPQESKMIVVSNGDIALNAVNKEEALPMGMNPYTKYKYANSDFILNAIEYLVDRSGILQTRAKDYTLRLLDKKKLEVDTVRWQLINILLPLVLVLCLGFAYQFVRKLRYQR
jgi:gliding-associated putative ABC transporter substrate-binding component GldG